MNNRSLRAVVFSVVAGAVALALSSSPASAQRAVDVGSTWTWTSAHGADNGQAGCRQGDGRAWLAIPCSDFLGETAARPAQREVETSARFGATDPPGVGIPYYSTASVYNDFYIPGPPDTLVDVQITVQFDFYGNMLAFGLYTTSNKLQLRLQDRTANALVATQELAGMQRQGDQGFTDVNVAQERAVLADEKGQLTVKLRRGHQYRLHFELESSGVTFLAGALRADAFARWNRLSINVDEDEVELLATHDEEVKAELWEHDAQIKAEIADLRDRLIDIEGRLEEIKTLLLTPQGRRPGFPINPGRGNGNGGGAQPAETDPPAPSAQPARPSEHPGRQRE